MKKLANFIGGEFKPPQGGAYFAGVNPATGEAFLEIPDSDASDVKDAVQRAKAAFPMWAQTPVRERARILYRVADLIEARLAEFAQAESEDQGKPVKLASELDIPRSVANFRFFAGEILHHTEQATHSDGVILNYTSRKPLGVAGLISPWNLPLYLLTWKIAPAIASGNTCVCKPSELTSFTAFLLGEVLNEAGVPPGVVNIVFGTGPRAGAPLTAHPDVPLISFTGGTETGKTIAQTAAPLFKRLSLELGGKNPNLIFADADLDQAVATTLRSSFLNQGEICLCGSRILVEEKIREAFTEKFVKAAALLKVGDPSHPDTFMGPVVSAAHFQKVTSYLEHARASGARFLLGGEKPKLTARLASGYFIAPTILTDVPSASRIFQEEIFGPVVTINSFTTDAEAIALANGVKYGLSASVWTQNLARAHQVSEALDCGTVWVNTWMFRDLRVPFGGSKASGMGREGGRHSLEFFTEAKNICVKYK